MYIYYIYIYIYILYMYTYYIYTHKQVGNGRLGAVLHMERWEEKMMISEESVWTGQPVDMPLCKVLYM